MRRRPKRSPSAAPLRMRTPKERMYASTIHSRLDSEPCRLRWMAGSVETTIKLSRTIMKSAAPVTARTAAARRGEWVMGSTLGTSGCRYKRGTYPGTNATPHRRREVAAGGAGRLPAGSSRRAAAGGRGPAGRRPPPYAGPAARGAGHARRRRHHLVHVARAGPRRAGVAGRAGGALTGAAPLSRRARAHDPPRTRRARAPAPGPEGDRLAGAAAPDRQLE